MYAFVLATPIWRVSNGGGGLQEEEGGGRVGGKVAEERKSNKEHLGASVDMHTAVCLTRNGAANLNVRTKNKECRMKSHRVGDAHNQGALALAIPERAERVSSLARLHVNIKCLWRKRQR